MNVHSATRFLLAGALLLAALVSPASLARAQEADTDADAEARYRELVAQGVDEFDRGNWGEAYVSLKQAYELQPGPRPLWGMGKALFEQGRYAETVETLERALSENEDSEHPLRDEQRGEAEALLERARSFVAVITLHSEPEDARFALDGREVGGPTLTLDAGTYRLVAWREGHRRVEQRLELEVGERRELTLRLVPVVADAGDADAVFEASVDEPGASPVLWPLLLLSAGGVALGAGAIVGAFNASDYSDLESKCQRGACTPADSAAIADGGTTQDMANALMFGGGALALAGAIWLVVDLAGGGGEAAPSETLALSCGTGGCGLLAEASF